MKILHIIAGQLNGGAARGAYCLHTALTELGVESKILTNSKLTYGDRDVISTNTTKIGNISGLIRCKLDKAPVLLYRRKTDTHFSTGYIGLDFTKHNEYLKSDIIHLHWINQSFVNIRHLSKLNKPLVWTLRDMWPFTGGCHYSLGCNNYKTGCGNCRQLGSRCKYDLSKCILRRKIKYIPANTKVVGISNWISDKAKESKLFNKYEIRTIYNNVDARTFRPIDKELARTILGIETNKKIILAGASYMADYYKGFNIFLEMLKYLDRDKYFLCFFGNIDKDIIENTNFEYRNFGYLYDTVSLRLAYSAADVFVAPSIEEAFGKTLVESMGCGTPVVCFDATGPKDIVTHKVDGYKAAPYYSKDLAVGIEWVSNATEYRELSNNAREKVLREFDSSVIARKYIDLYSEVISNKL